MRGTKTTIITTAVYSSCHHRSTPLTCGSYRSVAAYIPLHIPEPLSITSAAISSSSAMVACGGGCCWGVWGLVFETVVAFVRFWRLCVLIRAFRARACTVVRVCVCKTSPRSNDDSDSPSKDGQMTLVCFTVDSQRGALRSSLHCRFFQIGPLPVERQTCIWTEGQANGHSCPSGTKIEMGSK